MTLSQEALANSVDTNFAFHPGSSTTTSGFGNYGSLWQTNWWSYTPTAGNPTSYAENPAVRVPAGMRGFITRVEGSGSRVLHWMTQDLIYHSAFIPMVAGAASVSSGSLPARDRLGQTNGLGVEIWATTIDSPGTLATTDTITVTYTNSSGVGSRTTQGWNQDILNGRTLLRAILQSGDIGVRSIDGVSFSTTVTGVNWSLILARVLFHTPSASGLDPEMKDDHLTVMTEVYDGTVIWPCSRLAAGASNSADNWITYTVSVV